MNGPLPPAHPHSVRDVLPRADWVASVSGSPDLEGGDLRIWSRDDGSLRWSVSLSSRLPSLDVSPDDALLVVGTRNGWVQVWGAPP